MKAAPLALPPLKACAVAGVPDAFERRLLDLGLAAKAFASSVYVSGMTPEEAIARNARPETGAGDAIAFTLDRAAGLVHAATADGARRTARHYGDQGCVLLPVGAHQAFFEPVAVASALPPADAQAWPMGDAGATAPADPAIEAALDIAFGDPRAMTAAMVVVRGGMIVGERYGGGIGRETQLQSWSMGKTLTATLVARAAALGWLDLDAPAPLEEWSAPGDPRGAITLRHLLQMSGGLDFSALWRPGFAPERGYPDHAFMYAGAVDVERLALSRPAAAQPGALGAYLNCDTLALLAVFKRACRARGLHPLEAPQRLLFDRIGVRRLVIETDPYGNPVTTGLNFGTARDWARLAMLWLNDGVWLGERLLPAGFVDFARAPAPGWRGRYWMHQPPAGFADSIYGGQVWLNRFAPEDRWPAPMDAFYMLGVAGQYAFVIPSLDLVAVRLGHHRALEAELGREPFASALAALVRACGG